MRCQIHRGVLIDVASGLRVNVDDSVRPIRREVFDSGLPICSRFSTRPACPVARRRHFCRECGVESLARRGHPRQIITPKRNVIYSLGENGNSERALTLRAETEPDVQRIYWFADRNFLGVSDRCAPLSWQPKPGSYKVIALLARPRSLR